MSLLRRLVGRDAAILTELNFQLLLLANILAALGTALLSPVLDSLIGPFGASPATIGLMVSVFTAPAIFMIPIAGGIADKYGRKPVLTSSLLAYGVAGTAIAFTTMFPVALGLRLVQGIAFAGIIPVVITCIGDMYGGTREATAQGLRFTSAGFSQALFPVIAGVLVLASWRYPFAIYATAIPIAIFLHRYLTETGTVEPATEVQSSGASYRRDLLELLRERQLAAMVVARSLGEAVWIGFLTYNSIIVVQVVGGTATDAGMLVAVGSIVFAIVGSQAGRFAAYFENTRNLLIGANGLHLIGLVLIVFADTLYLAVVGVVIVGIGFGTTHALYRSIITRLATTDLRAGIVGISEAGGRLIATLSPIIMGGIIGLMTPQAGPVVAIQLAGTAVAVIGGGGGILSLLVAGRLPSLST